MQRNLLRNIKNMLPYCGLSAIAGCLSAILGTVFKLGAEEVIHLCGTLYAVVRQNLLWLPVLVLGAALLGLVASWIVSKAPSCKGGGIPSSAGAVRGMFIFPWLTSVIVLPFSALLTFFCGLPLGTEGPCVQMGTAVGDGVLRCWGSKKQLPWRRYVMTGGASAGFSVAAASPLSAIVFSVEDLQKKFSPLILLGVSVSVMTAQITVQLLSLLGIGSASLFQISDMSTLAPCLLFAPLLIGIICGLCSVLFTRFYHMVAKLAGTVMQKRSVVLVFPLLFAGMALVGVALSDALGTGHGLVEKLLDHHIAWYLLLVVFLVRTVFTTTANAAGVTGGLFLPTLAFGGIIGSLCADGMIALGWMEANYYPLMVVLGIVAFLGATSRIPLTAGVFAVESLGCIHNVPAVIIAITVAFLTAELSGVEEITETVIDAKLHSLRKGTEPTAVECSFTVEEHSFTVEEHSFAVGKEPSDILWPDTCTVVSVEPAQRSHTSSHIQAGDRITVRYKRYSNSEPDKELMALVGSSAENMQCL